MAQANDARTMAAAVAGLRERIARAARAAGRDPAEIRLCAVCKTRDAETVRASAALPVDLFGENHMQELAAHTAAGAYLGKPCHFIGHLQTNKVKKVVGTAAVIESIDSLRLLEAVESEAARQGIRQDVLFELNLGGEESKTGAAMDLLWPLLERGAASMHVRVRGLMTIPPYDPDPERSRSYFARLRALLEQARGRGYENAPLDMLSMGMSGSFEIAVAEGATIVRIGTAIYGARDPLPKRTD